MPLPPALLLQIQVGTDPRLCLICARKAGTELPTEGAGFWAMVVALPPACCWPPPPVSAQGGAQWGESSPVQPRLPIGYGAPQCPPPASPSPAGAATSVVMANAARSSGHSCASQRPASPTRSQTPQLRAPDPSPPARPPNPAAKSPQPLLAQAARPSPPSPLAHRACAPFGPARLGAQAPARGHSRPQRGSSGVGGRRQGRGAGKGGASPSFSERAQSWSQKSRRRDIQTEPRCVWQEEREGEREREEGTREGGKRGGRGNQGGGFSFQTMLSEPPRVSRAVQGRGTRGRLGPGGSGLRPMETAGHPSWPGQDGHRQKPRSMCAGQTERGLWAAQTYTRTSPHNGLLSMLGQGQGWGPQQGHHGRQTSGEALERPAHSQPLVWSP